MSEHEHHGPGRSGGIRRFVLDNSLLLVLGAVIALTWANTHNDSYEQFVHYTLIADFPGLEAPHHEETREEAQQASGDHDHETKAHDDSTKESDHGHGGLTVHYLINDILMAFFFAIAAKEVWEACLPGGPLSNPRKAATPLLAAAGGMLGPALLFLLGTQLLDRGDLSRGWAVPCATDIAFSYLVARLIFRPGHPAIAFLLLLAIADDAGGLMILAVAYPQKPLQFQWFLLTVAAIVLAMILKKQRVHSWVWYIIGPGVMCWTSFHMAGIHAALGLVPIIPCLPHSGTDMGVFAANEKKRIDTLNEFEHWWKDRVEGILGLFAIANAGVVFSNVGSGTALVLIGLVVGKPLGITLAVIVGQKLLGLQLPFGMKYKHVITVGMVAAIGFTVALFVATAAFPKGSPQLAEMKMGALASIGAAAIAIIGSRMLGVSRKEPLPSESKVGSRS